MTAHEIFRELQQFGLENTNQAIVDKYAGYFKEGYDAFGISAGMVDVKVKEILELPDFSQELMYETTLLLVASPKYEMPVMAFKMVRSFYKKWDVQTFLTVEKWFSLGINNWAHTDYICGELMPLFFKKNLITIDTLRPWRTATNKFQRRAAAVSLIKPMKLSSDFNPIFDFISPMMHDPERVVHQGLGWLLREMWKKQPAITEMFLLKYKDSSPRLIFQYATEKMAKEDRERFRKEKPTK